MSRVNVYHDNQRLFLLLLLVFFNVVIWGFKLAGTRNSSWVYIPLSTAMDDETPGCLTLREHTRTLTLLRQTGHTHNSHRVPELTCPQKLVNLQILIQCVKVNAFL